MPLERRPEHALHALCLFAAPALLVGATFFWRGHTVGLAGGVLTLYSFTFWIGAFAAMASLLRERMPRFAVWGGALAAFGAVGGTNFGIEGVVEGALGVENFTGGVMAEATPEVANALTAAFFLPGMFFPLMLLAFAVALGRARAVPLWCAAMLALGALGFAPSRIPRIQAVAFAADLLLLVPMWWMAWGSVRVRVRRAAESDVGAIR